MTAMKTTKILAALYESTKYLIPHLPAMHAMSKLGYAATPSIIAAAVLPDLWHRHNYLVKKLSVVGSLVFVRLWNASNQHQGEQIMPL